MNAIAPVKAIPDAGNFECAGGKGGWFDEPWIIEIVGDGDCLASSRDADELGIVAAIVARRSRAHRPVVIAEHMLEESVTRRIDWAEVGEGNAFGCADAVRPVALREIVGDFSRKKPACEAMRRPFASR